MLKLIVKVPPEGFIQVNELAVKLDSGLSHDIVNHLSLLEELFCLDGFLRLDLLLGQINISFLFIYSDDHHSLLSANFHEFVN